MLHAIEGNCVLSMWTDNISKALMKHCGAKETKAGLACLTITSMSQGASGDILPCGLQRCRERQTQG